MSNCQKRIQKLKGPFAALITPYDCNGRVNEAELRREVDYLCNTEIVGIFPCGSTGEFIHLSYEENMRVLKIVADEVKGRKKLAPGACASNFDTALYYLNVCAELGADAAVICPPYYIRMNQKEILDYYIALAEAKHDVDIVLYNIPWFTNPLELSTVNALMDYENIIGIKDSSANIKGISHTVDLAERKDDFFVFTGTDDALLPSLMAGCTGSMTAFGCCIPEVITGIYRTWDKGNITEAQRIQKSILKLLRLADSLTFPLGYKLVMECRGMKIGPYKQVISETAVTELKNKIDEELDNLLGNKKIIL